ncbi:hypothetical protein HPB48_004160 [Haemaphysalis longicornis]|uniref:Tick transposon n=1 Tax=Haemaphysalis longicornis TaxID=44386 RepID=A0A9J6GM42_HAELO|nr:hypothetical protein HPB48_004160 [Haemaphysalis longicornis]
MLFPCRAPMGHARRITRILRSELQRQIRYLHVCLRVFAATCSTCPVTRDDLVRAWNRDSSTVTEFLWRNCLPALCAWKRCATKVDGRPQKVTTLAQGPLPGFVEDVLSCGPKYCVKPNENPVSLLSIVRREAHQAQLDDKDRCISEGVDCLMGRKEGTKSKPLRVKKTIDYLRDNDLTLLTADKEGGFVVMPVSIYEEKSSQAIGKNFVPFVGRKTKIKKQALVLREHLNLPHLGKNIEAAKNEGLRHSFRVKPISKACHLGP